MGTDAGRAAAGCAVRMDLPPAVASLTPDQDVAIRDVAIRHLRSRRIRGRRAEVQATLFE
jgi:hypothetical protein